ncbi:hypothetical protein GCM10009737_33850 [Nocardioides lentus]|uniref:Glycosyltransferase n=1 Tax=Nocardioides lentus TaxID=338077 RepID=A0ABP5B3A1_9ACTN
MSAPRVSVVVTHYEQPVELARTLAALARQDRRPHEVVVSDDGSATPPVVPPGVRVVTQPDEGFRAAAARNHGAAAATGDVLAFLDADTAPEPSYLRRLVAPLAAHPSPEPDLLVVGRRRHTRFAAPPDPADPLAGAAAGELPGPAWLHDGWRATDDLRAADETSFRFVISATLACTADWFARVGGFDESFVGYGGEDWDLAHRWWTAGGRLRHVPGAVAWHDGPDAGDAERRDTATDEERAAGTLASARRVHAWPLALRGLRAGPARVVLTHDPGLGVRELVVAVDGFLAGCPQAVVVSDAAPWRELRDPRVRPAGGPEATRALLGVHLHEGVVAEPEDWAALVAAGAGGDVRRHVRTEEHGPGRPNGHLLTVTDLRRERRVALGLEPSTTHTARAPGLRRAGAVPLDAWLGGWWDR